MKKAWIQKVIGSGRLLVDAFRLLPRRLGRLFRQLGSGLFWLLKSDGRAARAGFSSIAFWWIELLFFALDCVAFPEIWEFLTDWFKFKTRPLTAAELSLAKKIFAQTIDYQRVRVDDRARLGPKQWNLAYVAGSTINSWGPISAAHFIHEMAHVWQFQTVGSVYVPRALRAQFSAEGYDYGGLVAIQKALADGTGLASFNYEQQADVIADFWRLENGFFPQWTPRGRGLEEFRRIVGEAFLGGSCF